MSITTVLFDLDGTLLPMDQDVFVRDYFGRLAKKMAPYGYDAQELIAAVWAGTKAMVKNTGAIPNEEAFWNTFAQLLGEDIRRHHGVLEEFYANEFQAVSASCGRHPAAAEAVRLVKKKGLRAVLATNPIFPAIATCSRIRWAGLNADDFELITTYENFSFCKPNPDYYREILRRIDVPAEECLMVGNDVGEDMIARTLGMEVFLLTDNLINKDGEDISRWPNGGFDQLTEYLHRL